jgi:hypothetical protein
MFDWSDYNAVHVMDNTNNNACSMDTPYMCEYLYNIQDILVLHSIVVEVV